MYKLIKIGLWGSLILTSCLELLYIYWLKHGYNQFSMIPLYSLVLLDFILLIVSLIGNFNKVDNKKEME